MKKVADEKIRIPMPGTPVRGSRSGDPIMALFDLLGRRWAMGVLWVLNRQGALTFRELQAACETVSPSVLNTRLKELREAGLIEHSGNGYVSTERGAQLFGLLEPLGSWAQDWANTLTEKDTTD
ncbi:winged helix-turn-helix transcriptional regulator [Roseibium sp.]|uniref:winged helix-turn-helix transcriptional regulator n=1 Tax=Roseibium sp. TaxID=1936156 RepID=UPI003A9796CC